MTGHAPKVARTTAAVGSEVQSAHRDDDQLRSARTQFLKRELDRPAPAAFIGGPICSLYDIENEIVTIRRSELEASLGLQDRASSATEIVSAGSKLFAVVQERLRVFVD